MDAVIRELDRRLRESTARGLAAAVTLAIRDGALDRGARLPPIRAVAAELELSPTTVSAAWALLARNGVVRTDGRRGTTVSDRPRPGAARYRRAVDRTTHFALDLSTGVPDPALLPDLSRAVRAMTDVAAPSSYLDDPVLPDLADVLRADWPYAADDITIVDGAMDGLELAARVLVGFGDRIAVEQPAFPPLLDLLESRGADVVPVPLDAEGMTVDGLRAAGPVAAVFLQPRAHNPTGVSMTTRRARALVAVLRASTAALVEDDSGGAIASGPAISLGSWLPERTVHIRSFAKSHGPDLRLAAMSASSELAGQLTGVRQLGQGWSSRLLQRLLLALLVDDATIGAVERARTTYAERREQLVTALADRGVEVGGSDGINVWVPVDDETSAVVNLASQGIGVAPGAPFFVRSGRPHIRVTAGLVPTGFDTVADAIAVAARSTTRVAV